MIFWTHLGRKGRISFKDSRQFSLSCGDTACHAWTILPLAAGPSGPHRELVSDTVQCAASATQSLHNGKWKSKYQSAACGYESIKVRVSKEAVLEFMKGTEGWGWEGGGGGVGVGQGGHSTPADVPQNLPAAVEQLWGEKCVDERNKGRKEFCRSDEVHYRPGGASQHLGQHCPATNTGFGHLVAGQDIAAHSICPLCK